MPKCSPRKRRLSGAGAHSPRSLGAATRAGEAREGRANQRAISAKHRAVCRANPRDFSASRSGYSAARERNLARG